MISIKTLRARVPMASAAQELEVLEPARLAVIRVFENATGRLWSKRTNYVQRLYVHEWMRRSGKIQLPIVPVASIEIKEWDNSEKYADAEVVSSDDYDVDPYQMVVRRITGCWDCNVEMKITGGVEDDDPEYADVTQAMIEQVMYWLERRRADHVGVSSQAFEGGSTTYLTQNLCASFQAVASQRRRVVV